ncbi:MAG: hypothetical protein ABR576_02345 [Thermoanaerobaculia bacterium]
MSEQRERVEALRRRGEYERETLAATVLAIRREIDERRSRWKRLSLLAGGAAAAGTVAFKLFGRNSVSAKLGRLASAASVLFSLGRAFGRARRFF